MARVISTNTNCIPIILRLAKDKTLPVRSEICLHPNEGTGRMSLDTAGAIINAPINTTVPSSVRLILFADGNAFTAFAVDMLVSI